MIFGFVFPPMVCVVIIHKEKEKKEKDNPYKLNKTMASPLALLKS